MKIHQALALLDGKEQARRVFNLLSLGKRSVVDITLQLRIADPRAVIRQIRDVGITVKDEWCTTEGGKRYKRYWVPTA